MRIMADLLISGTLRRLARRGGVKRISATVYDETRTAVKDRLGLVSYIPEFTPE